VNDPGTERSAVLSDCGIYRYSLTRRWSPGPLLGWVMLNPSIADALVDDPTIRRCVGFARRWGFAGIVVRNLYALRATDPRELARHPAPVGPDNHTHLDAAAGDALTVCAWGARGGTRGVDVAAQLDERGAHLVCLGLTVGAQPRHPLRLAAALDPVAYAASSQDCVSTDAVHTDRAAHMFLHQPSGWVSRMERNK